jgi:hypothetical protein
MRPCASEAYEVREERASGVISRSQVFWYHALQAHRARSAYRASFAKIQAEQRWSEHKIISYAGFRVMKSRIPVIINATCSLEYSPYLP